MLGLVFFFLGTNSFLNCYFELLFVKMWGTHCCHCCFTLILLLPRGNEIVFVYMCASYILKYEVVSAFCYYSLVLASGGVYKWASVFRICLKQLTITQGLALSVMKCFSYLLPFVITLFLPRVATWWYLSVLLVKQIQKIPDT